MVSIEGKIDLIPLRTRHIFSYRVTTDPEKTPDIVGDTGNGFVMVLSMMNSIVTGPEINGHFLPGAKDRVSVNRDGVSTHEVRSELLTQDGALITYEYEGRGFFGESGYDDIVNGRFPPNLFVSGAPYLQTSHPSYKWVNRLQCIVVGELDQGEQCFNGSVFGLI